MAGIFVERLGAPEGLTRRVLVGGIAAGFLALIAVSVAATLLVGRAAEHTQWVNHTYQVEVAIAKTQAKIEEAEASRRGYLLTGQPSFLDVYRHADALVDSDLDVIGRLIADNPRQAARIGQLRRLLGEISARQDATVALVAGSRPAEAQASFAAETAAHRMRRIRDVMQAMRDDERTLLRRRDLAQRQSVRSFYAILTGGGALIVLLALVTLATVMRYTRDLTSARDRLQALNADLEGAVAERTADLTRANEEIQRFAYIVSHDLRSPLVNVMGFTSELDAANATINGLIDRVEREAPGLLTADDAAAAREELPEAIGFIRTSTQKMDRLINAILRLSREGRRVLTAEPLDIAAIAATARDSMRHLADDRGAEVVVETPFPPLVSDRLAIEQLLSNLVENAIKYLAPDRPGRIVISGHALGDRVVIQVADNGRGIAESDHARIFDLFRRSGPQDQPGEGIGLAHVRALVYRLGGTIDVQSRLGEGSTFRLNLPVTLPASGSAQ